MIWVELQWNMKSNLNMELNLHLLSPRRGALKLRPKLKEELDRRFLVSYPVDIPIEWSSGIVIVLKQNWQIRICIDLTTLNNMLKRSKLFFVLQMPRFFFKLDKNCDYWQIQVAESSRLLTFITPLGRYCFNRLPFKKSIVPESYSRKIMWILVGIPGEFFISFYILKPHLPLGI